MLDICLLGTGGMMPLPRRYLTSMMARYNGSNILIDCGEGTQVAIKQKGWNFKPIDVICITHYHADHISGLPGLLLTMGNAMRTEPLTMIGPRGLKKVVESLRIVAPELPFQIEYIEMSNEEEVFQFDEYRIRAFRVNHNVMCYGYNIEVDRKGKFDVERALKLNVPKEMWKILQNGECVIYEGREYTPDMVMGEARKGLKVTYTTDTRPGTSIVKAAQGAQLFICEGMYGEKEKLGKAKEYKHMTMYEAADMARQAEVSEMWLTHYSPSLIKPDLFLAETQKIFKNTVAGKDGMSVDLKFED